jgi:ribosomal protein S18 acetylase RimI-like enzyme
MIREITQNDIQRDFLPLMAEVEAGSWFNTTNLSHAAWLHERVSRRIGRGGKFYALYSSDGTPMGLYCLLIEEHPVFLGYAEILDIGIFQQFRRHGHGTHLLQDAENKSRVQNMYCLYVSTYAGDDAAIAFYKEYGFCPVAELTGLNGPNDRGQLFMRKDLGQPSTSLDRVGSGTTVEDK